MTTAIFVDYADSVPRTQRQVADADLTLTAPPTAHDFFGRGSSHRGNPQRTDRAAAQDAAQQQGYHEGAYRHREGRDGRDRPRRRLTPPGRA